MTLDSTDSTETADLLQRAAGGDQAALNELFSQYRTRLKRMVRLRINRRLQARIDDSDVIQDAYLEVAKRLPDYVREPQLPFFLWLRHITGLKLIELHRYHLGTQNRDAKREISLHRGALPAATSVSLAAQMLGKLTSPTQAVVKAEMRVQLQEVLNSMEPLDREVLSLRHFEQLNNAETALELGISESGASSRYVRALKKLKGAMSHVPGFNQP